MARKAKEPDSFMDAVMNGFKAAGIKTNSEPGTIVGYYDKTTYIDAYDPLTGRPALAMEWLIGSRGFPTGKITQLRGSFSSAKSSFLYWVYACAMRGSTKEDRKAWVMHIETEGAPNPPEYVARFGVDPKLFAYVSENSLDGLFRRICAFDMLLHGGSGGTVNPETGRVVKSEYTKEKALDPDLKKPSIIGVDSLSNVSSDSGQDFVDINKSERPGGDSKDVRRYMRAKEQEFDEHKLTLFMTTHETIEIKTGGGGYGGPAATARNQSALGMALTLAIGMGKNYDWKGGKDGKEVFGSWQFLKTFKNKLAPRNRQIKLYRKDLGGFDMAETDLQFYLDPKASNCKENPFLPGGFLCPEGAKHGITKVRGGYSAPLVSDKTFKTAAEFVEALYSDAERLRKIRECLRIRGFGFDFETKYLPDEFDDKSEDTSDGLTPADVAEDMPDAPADAGDDDGND